MRLISPTQIKNIDNYCSDEGIFTTQELMDRAGAAFFAEISKRILNVRNKRFAVLCGKGNNGGDGKVTAQLLERAGARVKVYDIVPEIEEVPDFSHCDYILDCIFGTGFHGELPENIAKITAAVNASGKKVFAADIPSGVNGTDGGCDRHCVRANFTVAFCGAKPGHGLYPGREYCGKLSVKDIGIPEEIIDKFASPKCEYYADSEKHKYMSEILPKRPRDTHKGSFGKVGIIAGSKGMCGAAALTAEAALRTGAGLVYSFVPEELLHTMECLLRENVKLPVDDFNGDCIDCIISEAGKMDALAIGPGLGRSPEIQLFIRKLITRLSEDYSGKVLLDADGITAFEGRNDQFSEIMKINRFGSRVLITPHPAELSRITGDTVADICKARVDTAVDAARNLNCTVLLKGASTVTAAVDGRYTINGTGNPGMATAGSGDVLSGIGVALLARMDCYEAGRCGAFYHGIRGDRAALTYGEYGMIAGDLLR